MLDEAGFGKVTVLPLWPRSAMAAKLVLLQARRGASTTRLLSGLMLHEGPGFSTAANAILRSGDVLPM